MLDILQTFYNQLLQTTLTEWIATISGFVCVYLAAKQNILNWPISIISVTLYLVIFYQNKLYGDAALQLYFLGTAVYGWYYWDKVDKSDEKPVTSLSPAGILNYIMVIILLTILIGVSLNKFSDSDVPYIDAFCTSMSLVAQYQMTRKILQNWILWIIVDFCYIPLYLHKNLILTAILYIAFAVIAFKGYLDWRKSFKNFN